MKTTPETLAELQEIRSRPQDRSVHDFSVLRDALPDLLSDIASLTADNAKLRETGKYWQDRSGSAEATVATLTAERDEARAAALRLMSGVVMESNLATDPKVSSRLHALAWSTDWCRWTTAEGDR